MNPFKYTLDNKRYKTFNYYLKTTYGCKVAKVMIDAHFTCPNRDGNKGINGCTFCSNKGSGDSNFYTQEDILDQYNKNKSIMNNKWQNNLYIPYFQSYSNTYGSIKKIKSMIEPFISLNEVAEISIATRCDCLDDEIIEYLNSLTCIKPIWLELGLQTSKDESEKYLNRCYTFHEFKDAIEKLSKTNIKICIHIIDGLPFETEEDMLQTIKDINHLHFHAIKIHMLHILKNTKIYDIYKETNFKLLTREEYIDIVIKQLELIKEDIIVERLTSDPIGNELFEPKWLLNKTTLLNDIDKLMVKNKTYQGKKYK